MPKWGRNDQAVTANSTTTKETTIGAPIGVHAYVKGGTGAMGPNAHYGNTSSGTRASIDKNLFGNTTVGAFIPGQAVGVMGVSPTEMQNNISNSSREMPGHAGWVIRKAGTGPVVSAVGANGSLFANGETVTVSGGTTNATLVITTNATQNIASVSVRTGGAGWANSGQLSYTFVRELHVNTAAASPGGTGYANTDYVIVSNGALSYGVSANLGVTTNSTGGITSLTIVNVGLFAPAQTNAGLQFAVKAANGAASNGSGATITANLVTSTGGSVTATLGGRAGRVHTETLVAMGSLGSVDTKFGTAVTANDSSTDNSFYPGV